MPRALRDGLRVATGAAVLVALVGAGGCGSNSEPQQRAKATQAPDRATKECRAQWADLAEEIEGNEKREEPSALASRWNSVVGTVDYYATFARSSDCGERLEEQKQAISRLRAFGESLRRWDMEYQLTVVQSRAEDYTPPKRSKKDHKPAPPSARAVKRALATLRKQAPAATQDQRPGWLQTHVVDLEDKAEVKKARKDLQFLSEHSSAWRRCDRALRVIRKALRA